MQKPTRKNTAYFLITMVSLLAFLGVIPACTEQSATAKPNIVYKPAPNTEAVAKIAGKDVNLEELIGDSKLSYLELQKRIYEFKMERLNQLIQERLIGEEAQKAGMKLDEYIEKKVVQGANKKITDAEFNKFVEEKHIPKTQINPQLKERITNYLGDQKKDQMVQSYLAKLTKSQPVEVYFQKPKVDITIDVGQAPVWGDSSAKVTVFEFSDFQCPFCSKAAATMAELKKKYKGKIKIAFKHFPLSFHKEAKPAAEASMCVNEQSPDKFWKFYNVVFENQKALDPASLEKYAKQAGADVAKYKQCMDSHKFAALVDADTKYGEKLGVRSTPTFFINGEIISGAVPVEQFQDAIDEALKSAKN